MLIEIQCGNFSGYDDAKRKYVPCGEKLIVSSDQVGELVTCTKCHQEVEVPYGIGTTSQSSETSPSPKNALGGTATQDRNRRADASSTKRRRTSENKPQPSRPAKRKTGQPGTVSSGGTKRGAKSSPAARRPSNPPNNTNPAFEDSGELFDDAELALAEPVQRPASDVMALSFGTEDPSQSTLAEDRHERCKKCGNISKNGRCTVCKHVESQFEKLHLPMEKIAIEPSGLQRWFCRTMNEGVSIKVLEYGSHVAFGALGFALLGLAIASLFGVALGTVGGVLLLIFVFASAGLYAALVHKGHQFLRDPHARLAWFQVPFWNLILALSRAAKWQSYDKSLTGRKIITIRDKMFGDVEIAELPGIKNCQVLDLEGTCVTDQGLLPLYHLNHLHCLVLKGTNVTHEGVFRLQQSCPRLWIWY